MAPSRRWTGSSRRTARRNSSARSGSTSYSSVTSTGPSSPSSWHAVSGNDQRGSGRRSRFERPCSTKRREATAPASSIAAPATSAVGMSEWVATTPQRRLPSAMLPWTARRPTASARARTHAGTAFWAATLSVDMAPIHAIPPMKSPPPAISGTRARATTADTAANTAVPASDPDGPAPKRRRVQEKDPARPQGRHQEPAERRAEGARNVDRDAAQRDGARELLARHQVRRRRLPGGRVERIAEAHAEGEREQQPRSRAAEHRADAERGRGDEHPRLRHEAQPAAVDDVGEGPGGQRQEEERQARRRLHERHHERRGREPGHEPRGARVVHPRADVRDARGEPERPEDRVGEGAPG